MAQPTQEREQNQARLNYAERQGGKELSKILSQADARRLARCSARMKRDYDLRQQGIFFHQHDGTDYTED